MNSLSITKNKKLIVFDFDDTLVKSKKHKIFVIHKNGTKTTLDGKNWNKYVPAEGDIFDFSHFENLINPIKIETTWKILIDRLRFCGYDNVHVVTARSSKEPLEKYFECNNVHVQVHGLGIPPGQNNGIYKANWIKQKIENNKYEIVEFFDDRDDCVTEVSALKKLYSNVVFYVWQINEDETLKLI